MLALLLLASLLAALKPIMWIPILLVIAIAIGVGFWAAMKGERK